MRTKDNSRIIASVETVAKQIVLIIIALALATIFLAVSGYEPFAIVEGIWNSLTVDIAGTIRWMTPLALSGLAVCVTYKAEVFNLGVDGQIYMGASAAAAVALFVPESLNQGVSLVFIFLAAMAAGAAFAMIPALMKVYLNTNEIVSTLLLNFVAELFVEYLVTGPLRDPSEGTNLNASEILSENTWLPRLSYFQPSTANVGFYIAVIVMIILAFVFYKTAFGHEIKIVGANPTLARYAGMKPKKTIFQVMALSGMIGGIVGAIEVTAVQHRLLTGFNPDFGMTGIVVTLLANNNPIGVLFSGAFFGAIHNGGINMERLTSVPSAVTDIVTGIIFLMIGAKFVLPRLKKLAAEKKSTGKGGN
ncbi:MAG TPA: ABC transporter permease [Candidatus Mediterraneibacter merdipullorum]|nr:ABC transporter permease [Candidatus Mediterraneibacter merdipullorum]